VQTSRSITHQSPCSFSCAALCITFTSSGSAPVRWLIVAVGLARLEQHGLKRDGAEVVHQSGRERGELAAVPVGSRSLVIRRKRVLCCEYKRTSSL